MALTLQETDSLLAFIAVDQPSVQSTPATKLVWLEELQDHWITLDLAMSAIRLYRRRTEAEMMRFRFLDIATFHHYLRRARDVKRAEIRSAEARKAIPPGPKKVDDPFRVKFPEQFARAVAEGKSKAAGERSYAQAIAAGKSRHEATEIANAAYKDELAALAKLETLTDRTPTP